MGKYTKNEINARLRAEMNSGRAVYDALCGTGITAKMAARGGADLVTTFNLAHYRMQGLSSMAGYLPIGDANAITLELGERSILNVVKECPVIGGVLGVGSGVLSETTTFAKPGIQLGRRLSETTTSGRARRTNNHQPLSRGARCRHRCGTFGPRIQYFK